MIFISYHRIFNGIAHNYVDIRIFYRLDMVKEEAREDVLKLRVKEHKLYSQWVSLVDILKDLRLQNFYYEEKRLEKMNKNDQLDSIFSYLNELNKTHGFRWEQKCEDDSKTEIVSKLKSRLRHIKREIFEVQLNILMTSAIILRS